MKEKKPTLEEHRKPLDVSEGAVDRQEFEKESVDDFVRRRCNEISGKKFATIDTVSYDTCCQLVEEYAIANQQSEVDKTVEEEHYVQIVGRALMDGQPTKTVEEKEQVNQLLVSTLRLSDEARQVLIKSISERTKGATYNRQGITLQDVVKSVNHWATFPVITEDDVVKFLNQNK